MSDNSQIDQIIKRYGFTHYKWLVPRKDIIVAQWVRFHCLFGCNNSGKNGSCPPALPSIEECREMIYEYENAIIFHFPMEDANEADAINLMIRLSELEREVFLEGYYKAFLLQLGSCSLCKNCVAEGTRNKCINKTKARPGADAMGIDVYQTAHNAGYPIQVVKNKNEPVNRFAFLLID
jgi:predicted metal-binding protein